MSALEIFKAVEEGGLKSAGIVIILVVARATLPHENNHGIELL